LINRSSTPISSQHPKRKKAIETNRETNHEYIGRRETNITLLITHSWRKLYRDIITKQSINVVKTEGEGKLVYMKKDRHKASYVNPC
jgi:hypothetical protein